jgi:DNA-binding LacI/PurR family transcriptional regulator
MATIAEVARRAGVGVGTVSRVLNGHAAVAPATRERVAAAIAELDYQPSPIARNLKRGRTQRIAVLVSFLTSPAAVERLRGLTHALSGSGYEQVLYPVPDDDERERHLWTLTGPHQADGIVLISVRLRDDEAARLRAKTVSLVQIDARHPAFARVLTDDVHGGELAAAHLLALGHREIGFIGDDEEDPRGFTSSRDRHIGFARALAAAGAPLPDRLVRTGPHGAETAARLASQLLGDEPRPTAIFAASDTQAFGVMLAARQRGLRVPEDLSVLGFDDIDAAGHVGLSTVRQPLAASGRLAAELLLQDLAAPGSTVPADHWLPLETVPRSTTRHHRPGGEAHADRR